MAVHQMDVGCFEQQVRELKGEIMNDQILFDKVIGKKRCIMRKDKYNWIWQEGDKGDTLKQVMESHNRSYYTKFEPFLADLLEKNFRSALVKFDTDRVLRALKRAHKEVRMIGIEIDKNTYSIIQGEEK